MAESFFGRWSLRKQAVRDGKALAEPPAPLCVEPRPVAVSPTASVPANPAAAPVPVPAAPVLPAPSLEDVEALTTESDFIPFVARDVAPEVRNAAMKKLFADPHYNVMDRMDTYIDDYSQPDPLPESMLRQMASARFLKLFEDEEEGANAETLTESTPHERGKDHDNPDLRLQPNDAAGRQKPGRGTE
jgi:hypothetical protein